MADDPKSVGDVLDKLKSLGEEDGDGTVKLSKVIETLGNRSYGPFLLVPALIEMSPIGGIPGIPTFLALVIVLFAAQMLFGRSHLWLPDFIGRRGVTGRKMVKAVDKLRGAGDWMDRWFHGRLPRLTKPPFVQIAAVACIALAATVPPLELLPFASTAPMLAIAAFGLALLVRDGALMIAASIVAVAAFVIGFGVFVGQGMGSG